MTADAYGIGQLIGRGIRAAFGKKLGLDPNRPIDRGGNPNRGEYYFIKQSQSNFSGPMCSIGSYIPSRGGAIQMAMDAKRREPNTNVQVFDSRHALVISL